jgi:hypothetical protein
MQCMTCRAACMASMRGRLQKCPYIINSVGAVYGMGMLKPEFGVRVLRHTPPRAAKSYYLRETVPPSPPPPSKVKYCWGPSSRGTWGFDPATCGYPTDDCCHRLVPPLDVLTKQCAGTIARNAPGTRPSNPRARVRTSLDLIYAPHEARPQHHRHGEIWKHSHGYPPINWQGHFSS